MSAPVASASEHLSSVDHRSSPTVVPFHPHEPLVSAAAAAVDATVAVVSSAAAAADDSSSGSSGSPDPVVHCCSDWCT